MTKYTNTNKLIHNHSAINQPTKSTVNQHGVVVPSAESIIDVLSQVTSIDQLEGKDNVLGELFQQTVDTLLEAEMGEHLGRSKYERLNSKTPSAHSNHKAIPNSTNPNPNLSSTTPNYRNGHSTKKLKTSYGELDVTIPRDRAGDFTPTVISKNQKSSKGLDSKILSLYTMGNTTTEISEHLSDMYGFSVSPQYISTVTDKILPMVSEWQNRELESIYPIIFLDAIKYKVRIDKDGIRKVIDKSIYIILGINIYGRKEVLGIYPGDSDGSGYGESAKYWMHVLSELRCRRYTNMLYR